MSDVRLHPIYVPCRSKEEIKAVEDIRQTLEVWALEKEEQQASIAEWATLSSLHLEAREASRAGLAYSLACGLFQAAREEQDFDDTPDDWLVRAIWLTLSIADIAVSMAIKSPQERDTSAHVYSSGKKVRDMIECLADPMVAFLEADPAQQAEAHDFCLKFTSMVLACDDDLLVGLAYDPSDFGSDILPRDGNGDIIYIPPDPAISERLLSEHKNRVAAINARHAQFTEKRYNDIASLLHGHALKEPITALRRFPRLVALSELLTAAVYVEIIRTETLSGMGDQRIRPLDFPGNSVIRAAFIEHSLSQTVWTPAAIAVLKQFAISPGKINRLDPGPDGMPAKRALRPFGKIIAGLSGLEEYKKLVESINSIPFDLHKTCVALISLIEAAVDMSLESGNRFSPFERATSERILSDGLCFGLRLTPFDINGLIASARPQAVAVTPNHEEADVLPPAKTVEAWSKRRRTGDTDDPPVPVEERRYRFHYIQNPFSHQPHVKTEIAEAADMAVAVARLINEHATPIEPVSSLVRAILQYGFAMDESHRQVWNKERIGPHVFHKLKRGRDRIYARADGDDIYFHVYQRRDWNKFDLRASVR